MNEAVVKALEGMELRDSDQAVLDHPVYRDRILEQIRFYPSFALPSCDDPAVVCGFMIEGYRAEAWMLVGKNFKGRVVADVLCRQRSLIRSIIEAFDLRELCMSIDLDRKDAARWAIGLGFSWCGETAVSLVTGELVEVWRYSIEKGSV